MGFNTEKWFGRRLWTNWDLSVAIVKSFMTIVFMVLCVVVPAGALMVMSSWPYKLHPNDITTECPVITSADHGNEYARKINMCKQYYAKQYR